MTHQTNPSLSVRAVMDVVQFFIAGKSDIAAPVGADVVSVITARKKATHISSKCYREQGGTRQ